MPWTCKVCHTVYTADNNDYGLACFKNKECKAKGLFACAWTDPPQQAAVLTEAQEAAALGYPHLHNSFQDKFPKKHKTNSMYVNANSSRGISYDGSTHSNGRSGWKGFNGSALGWNYVGSFQMNLDFWPHRPNDAQVAFPRGDA